LGGETARDNAAGLGPRDEARVRQNVEMLHDRRERHRERPGELAYGNVLVLVELREQSAPRGVGKGGEGAVERGVLILNHVVKCRGARLGCQSRSRGGNGVATVFQEQLLGALSEK
jgi:hypothetical protein